LVAFFVEAFCRVRNPFFNSFFTAYAYSKKGNGAGELLDVRGNFFGERKGEGDGGAFFFSF
jgi:hypothetical protein